MCLTLSSQFLLDEFQMANFKIGTLVHENNMQWTPPMILWFKLNVDGATFALSQTVGSGASYHL